MCGRFTLTVDPTQLEELFPWAIIPHNMTPRYNIAPSQDIAVIPNVIDYQVEYFRWGLIPSWAKDPSISRRLINARSETLHEKPSFREALKRRRCLILADGFYEWTKVPSGESRVPIYIHLSTGKPFTFAGLWDQWISPDGAPIRSCTIITTQPNSLIMPLHNRMPVIIPQKYHKLWLEPREVTPIHIQNLLNPYPAELMEAYPVSGAVNSPINNYPTLLDRISESRE